MQTQKTILYNFHKNLGAKFVPFAGYEMPIQYKDGIVKEHISTRESAGFFDVSHMGQLFLSGDKALENSLEKIIPLDLKEIKLNQSKYSFLINNKGEFNVYTGKGEISVVPTSEGSKRKVYGIIKSKKK